MSICVPSESCGINADYESEAQGITFAITDAVHCVDSSADALVEGEDCSSNTYGCFAGLVCAMRIVDGEGANRMSICIPSASCGVNEDYISSAQGITFAITD